MDLGAPERTGQRVRPEVPDNSAGLFRGIRQPEWRHRTRKV